MRKTLIMGALGALALAALSTSAQAADGVTATSITGSVNIIGGGLAAMGGGLAAIGAGLGIGRAGGSACDAIARQPESKDEIVKAMLIAAALVEGVALFGMVIAILVVFK